MTPLDKLRAAGPRLRAVMAATYALLSGWRDSHGTPLRTPPPTLASLAAELRAVAATLDPGTFPPTATSAPMPDARADTPARP
jgi:hypothetical protein